MQVLVCRDAEEAADLVAAEILAALARKPDLVLGLATGSTPLGVYARLVRARKERGVTFARVRTFNLDEYVGLPPEHPRSFRSFMRTNLFDGLDVKAGNVHFPPNEGPDLPGRCRRFEDAIREAGGIDLQLLGIGSNGHIGFNEPTSSLGSRTRPKTLAGKTLEDNARHFRPGEAQPQVATTMGIATILEAKRVLLQAFGPKKAEAIRASVEGPVTSFWPGSALQLHPDVAYYLDAGSASLLAMRDYYERVREARRGLERDGTL